MTNPPMRSVPAETFGRPLSRIWNFLPWIAVGACALGAAWLGQQYVALQAQVKILRTQNELIEIALRSAEQQLEAERIIGQWRLTDAKRPLDPRGAKAGPGEPELVSSPANGANKRP